MSLPPWDQLVFTFGWTPEITSIPQCSTININFDTDTGPLRPNPAADPPYSINVYSAGFKTLTFAPGNFEQAGTYPWIVGLPVGTQFMLTMKDSFGYSGGTSQKCTVVTGNAGCSPGPMTPGELDFTRTGYTQCGMVNYVMHNGTSPFTVEIMPENRQQRTLHFATNQFGFILDIPSSISYVVGITDSQGRSIADGITTPGPSNDASCLNAAKTMTLGMFSTMFSGSGSVLMQPTSTKGIASPTASTTQGSSQTSAGSKTSIGIIVGAAVAGVVAIAALILLVCWLFRRNRRKRREAQVAVSHPPGNSPKPEVGQVGPGYNLSYSQQPYASSPPYEQPYTDTRTPFQGHITPYTGPGSIPTGHSSGFQHDTFPAQYSDITTYAPQPRVASQALSYQSDPTMSSQSPTSHTYDQRSGVSTPHLGNQNSSEGAYVWPSDRKDRVAPSPSDSAGGTSQAHPAWGMATSPPPRSMTATALPPYERGPQGGRTG